MTDDRFKLHWGTYADPRSLGNAYGYRVHNESLLAATRKIANVSNEAEDTVQIVPPESFRPILGYYNWLFTMFEGMDLPDFYLDRVPMANYGLVPSTWVKDLFAPIFPTIKFFVVNHGVSPVFTFKERRFPRPGEKFRFLWVGAPNPRKGYEEAITAWALTDAIKHSHLELYIKTTNTSVPFERKGNVILDGRNLPRRMLLDLYHDAHCFLFPTRGEGFGLTLAEAMATGLPCISTCTTGVSDFFGPEFGYVVPTHVETSKVGLVTRMDLGGIETKTHFPDTDALSDQIVRVVDCYDEALELGRRASEHIKKNFTWERSAETLISVMRHEYEARHACDTN